MQANVLRNQPASFSSSSITNSQMATNSNNNSPGEVPPRPSSAHSSDEDGPLDMPSAQEYADRHDQHHPIAEFLYQLTKMLTEDNGEIIEWSDGRIKVHHPERLEAEVLHKYFRHSKFASFQRQ
jgi:HSF-type DNA-binding